MKKNLRHCGWCLLVLSATAMAQTVEPAQQLAPVPVARAPSVALTATGLQQRWEAIGNLLERSSAARHIEKDGSAESKEIQQQARKARADAKLALDAGELEKADALLREASKLMFKAERASRPTVMTAEKAKNDFVQRRESVIALLQTGRRVAGEKGANKPEFSQGENLTKEADAMAAEGKHAEGRVKLDQAYALITGALRSLRGGDELTADKNFATKADEYKYEQARNDDYQGLISGVIQDKDASWTDVAKNSRALRDEADRMAAKKDHESALQKINESTGLLKGLLRRAGFPII